MFGRVDTEGKYVWKFPFVWESAWIFDFLDIFDWRMSGIFH